MNLVFDIGNSSSKMAVYDGRTKTAFFRTKEFSFEKLHKKMSKYQIEKAIVCSVKDIPEFIIDISHQIGTVFIHFVVVGISTTVTTKLFILAANYFFFAL